jgi:hypothetical protein
MIETYRHLPEPEVIEPTLRLNAMSRAQCSLRNLLAELPIEVVLQQFWQPTPQCVASDLTSHLTSP